MQSSLPVSPQSGGLLLPLNFAIQRTLKMEQTNIIERIELIERMIALGKKSTERHGWTFVLWGIGYLVATLWVLFLPHADWAWSSTMPICGLLTWYGMS